ncbi:MAG: radical SAM protein [Candidatus Lokiarchaeota archaeon]|nr:radical SAM protein [Candidatus Lokiarchaeota archaeon]
MQNLNLPRFITLQLTEMCNLRCKMCYYWGENGAYIDSKVKNKPKVLDFKIVKNLIKDLAPSTPNYSLFGGEPLLYPCFEELIDEIKKYKSFVDTPTNGTLLFDNAELMVNKEFDLVRVSIDGPQEINDNQRGLGSYEKAINGINHLFELKEKKRVKKPLIDIIYTVTPDNYKDVEQFFLQDINISQINQITIQMQNYLTNDMGERYAKLLISEFGIQSDKYWRGIVQSPSKFNGIDKSELSRQVNKVRNYYSSQNKSVLLLPPTFSPDNLEAYLMSNWGQMSDLYEKCFIPWISADIVASGEVAPCHIFYDLILGNLNENSISEIWNGANYKKFREFMERNYFMPICPGCCILYLAGKKLKKNPFKLQN